MKPLKNFKMLKSMGLITFSLLVSAVTLAGPQNQSFSVKDRAVFQKAHKDMMKTGRFKVLSKIPKASVQQGKSSRSPFADKVQKIEKALITKGVTQAAAHKKAIKQVQENIVRQKDIFRSGGMSQQGVGTNFCRKNPKGGIECLSDQVNTGRRASHAYLRAFMLDSSYKTSLKDMAFSAEISKEKQPWSDDYWAIYKGVLGWRYNVDDYELSDTWDSALNYILSSEGHLSSVLKDDVKTTDDLSPGEKYDLLIGTANAVVLGKKTAFELWSEWFKKFPEPVVAETLYSNGLALTNKVGGYFTAQNWRQGQQYFDRDGEVETWMGICHGWATAAVQLPRPTKPVEVLAADGVTKIKFYPSDIKALGSYLWANNAPRSRFIGGRCNDKDVDTDEDSGAIINSDCFDTNPSDWHTVVTNYISVYKHSFVMDTTFDYEVWNQPVLGYKLEYFNIEDPSQRADSAEKLKDILTEWAAYSEKDPFKKVRTVSDNTKYIIGVEMTVDYLVETEPSHSELDSYNDDSIDKAYYTYDLELTEDLVPTGGEWHQNLHPDFLWSHDPKSVAISSAERYNLGYGYEEAKKDIDFSLILNSDVRGLAESAAQNEEVLGAIVFKLFEESSKVEPRPVDELSPTP